jgi:uncharacterized protein
MDYQMSAAESLNTAVAGVLSRMALGVFGTMLVAAAVVSAGLVPVLFSGILGYVLIFAPLAMSLFLAWRADTMSAEAVKFFYIAFAVLMGVSLSLLFSVYTTASIVQALIGTTVSFGALAAWGYFTRRDISGWGPFLFAGVIGLIVASLFNIWFESSALQTTLNVLAIVIFLGLTAYDMNRIRDMFWSASEDTVAHLQWLAALSLYINFINIFVNLLQLFGNRE